MRFGVVVLVFIVIEIALVLFFYNQTDSAGQALQIVSIYSRRICLGIFSFIFLWKHQKTLLTKFFSSHYYTLFFVLFFLFLLQLVSIALLEGYDLVPYRVALYLLASAITLALPIVQYLHEKNLIRKDIFPVAEQLFAYLLWMLFFAYYYSKVEKGYSFGMSMFKENVIILAWISLLMGYRISRIFRAKLPSERQRRNGS